MPPPATAALSIGLDEESVAGEQDPAPHSTWTPPRLAHAAVQSTAQSGP